MPPRSLRDLLPELPPNPTLHDVVAANPPVETVTDFERGLVAALPGDDISRHPAYQSFEANPYRGQSPQRVMRALKDGSIPTQEGRKQAMEWISLCERCGEKLRAYRPDG
jgi:hypothetical protein